jgi:uncharacterized phage protein (TIGR01671 family)
MNRPIKFRAFANGKMHEVRAISFTETGEVHRILDSEGVQRVPEALLQFTGLTDKSSKEICEGDILRYCAFYPRDFQERNPHKRHGRIAGPVTRKEGWLFVEPPIKGSEETLLYKGEDEQWEVIGNIYENPELLAH